MFDGIYLACQEKLKGESGRKIMILISDGDDNLSLQTLAGTLEIAQKSDVSIFAIITNSSGFFGITAPKADKVLKRLADTGGRAFFPFKAEDLSESFQDISAELRNQYSLAYRSSNPARDGSPSNSRQIERISRSKPAKVTTPRRDRATCPSIYWDVRRRNRTLTVTVKNSPVRSRSVLIDGLRVHLCSTLANPTVHLGLI